MGPSRENNKISRQRNIDAKIASYTLRYNDQIQAVIELKERLDFKKSQYDGVLMIANHTDKISNQGDAVNLNLLNNIAAEIKSIELKIEIHKKLINKYRLSLQKKEKEREKKLDRQKKAEEKKERELKCIAEKEQKKRQMNYVKMHKTNKINSGFFNISNLLLPTSNRHKFATINNAISYTPIFNNHSNETSYLSKGTENIGNVMNQPVASHNNNNNNNNIKNNNDYNVFLSRGIANVDSTLMSRPVALNNNNTHTHTHSINNPSSIQSVEIFDNNNSNGNIISNESLLLPLTDQEIEAVESLKLDYFYNIENIPQGFDQREGLAGHPSREAPIQASNLAKFGIFDSVSEPTPMLINHSLNNFVESQNTDDTALSISKLDEHALTPL